MNRAPLALLPVFLPALLLACASTPGAQPHDMSVAGHEAMAQREDRVGSTHLTQYDSRGVDPSHRCQVPRTSGGDPCWVGLQNPTAEHLESAKRHQKMAADHRAASQALRDAEASSCIGLSDETRDASPFDHREDIANVEPLTVNLPASRGQTARMEGAVVTFRAVPGLTAEWLQRAVDCHLARNAALGHDVPEMPNCPLVPKNVAAKVTSTGSGFAVAVRSEDSGTANEVLRRARVLVAP